MCAEVTGEVVRERGICFAPAVAAVILHRGYDTSDLDVRSPIPVSPLDAKGIAMVNMGSTPIQTD